MTIDRDPLHLHPLVRDAVAKTLASCKAAGIPFAMFEGFRSPVRQAALYAQGRTAPGPIVTYARAGESHHNCGMAADLCGFVDGLWTWDLPDSAWRMMAAFGKTWGLESLSFERPHLQWAKARLTHLQSGIYPAGGCGATSIVDGTGAEARGLERGGCVKSGTIGPLVVQLSPRAKIFVPGIGILADRETSGQRHRNVTCPPSIIRK